MTRRTLRRVGSTDVFALNWMSLKRDSLGTSHMTRSWNLQRAERQRCALFKADSSGFVARGYLTTSFRRMIRAHMRGTIALVLLTISSTPHGSCSPCSTLPSPGFTSGTKRPSNRTESRCQFEAAWGEQRECRAMPSAGLLPTYYGWDDGG